jgi:NAD(P)-dependent dehydrogenase (short-subunit alcohol dehydrogenase family)
MLADMTDPAQLEALGKEALDRMGRIDVLVNNAGSNVPQPIDEITDEAWSPILELNLTSIMRLTRMLVPQMKARKWGRIIHIYSQMVKILEHKQNQQSAMMDVLNACPPRRADFGMCNRAR